MDSDSVLALVVTVEDRAVVWEDLRRIEEFLYQWPVVELAREGPAGLSFGLGKKMWEFICRQDRPLEVVRQVRRELEAWEVMVLTIGFAPTAVEAEKIVNDARAVVGQKVLVDLRVDKSLLGGIRLAYLGRYIDLSLATLVREYFEANKSSWLKRLKLL